jgi:hypothetical protein
MPATMQSVTTRGYGISGGFTGSANLVVTLGYGIGEAVAATVHTVAGTWEVPTRTGTWEVPSRTGTWEVPT